MPGWAAHLYCMVSMSKALRACSRANMLLSTWLLYTAKAHVSGRLTDDGGGQLLVVAHLCQAGRH